MYKINPLTCLILAFTIVCKACKQQQIPSSKGLYIKYESGIGGSRGIVFYFKIPNANLSGDLQSVYINDVLVPFTTKIKTDTLMIEANAFKQATEKGFPLELEMSENPLESAVINAPSYEACLVFLGKLKPDSIYVTKFKSLNVPNQTLEQ